MKKLIILFLLFCVSFLNGQTAGMWRAGNFGGPVTWGIPSGSNIYFSQGNKLYKGNEGAENIEIVSASFLQDAATQIKINGDNLYAIYGTDSEYKNNITSTTLSNLSSSSSNNFSGIDSGINKFDEIDGFGLLAHNKDGVLSDKLVGEDLLGNTNDSFEYITDFKDFTINGYIAYLITDDGTTDNIIEIIDFSAKSSANKVGSILVKQAQSVYYSNGYLYVACENGEGLKIIDVSDSSSPVLAGKYDANSFTQVLVNGTTAYLRKDNILTILNVTNPTNPVYVSSKIFNNLSTTVKFTDVVNGKIYYVDNGIFGIIETSTLSLGQKYLSALSSDWVAADETTLVVYDKANYYFHSLDDPYNPKAYAVLTAEFEPVDFAINGNDFYVTKSNKLHIYDIENLNTAGNEFSYYGEFSVFKVADDFAVIGEYKYSGSTKFYYFEIIDLSDKSNPTQLHLEKHPTIGTITSIELSPDNNTLYLISELEGKIWLAIFDITNKLAPTRVYLEKLETITSNTINGKNTKLGINGTELYVVTNYKTINGYYAAKIFAYSVIEPSNPKLIAGLQITESEYSNVSFWEEHLFIAVPNDKEIHMYSLVGDETLRKEWSQIETLPLKNKHANMALYPDGSVATSSFSKKSKFNKINGDEYDYVTVVISEEKEGTEIIKIYVKKRAKVHLTTSILPTEAATDGCSVSPSAGEYYINSATSITANAALGWVFDNWSGDLTGSASTSNLTMDSDKNVIGNFKPILDLNFTSIDAQNIKVPKNDEKVHIGSAFLTANGVDWELKSLKFTPLEKIKPAYTRAFINYDGSTKEGTFSLDGEGYISEITFALTQVIPKNYTLIVGFYYMFDFPLNAKNLLAPLDEIKKLGISYNRSQVVCDPIINVQGVKEPADNFVSNYQTIGWIWNISLTPHVPFLTIQDAIDDPRTLDGHEIGVGEGLYFYLGVVDVNKSLKIFGMGERSKTFIQGSNNIVFKITSDDVEIKNLNIENIRIGTEGDKIIEVGDSKNNVKITLNKFRVTDSLTTAIFSYKNNFLEITDNDFELEERIIIIDILGERGYTKISGNKDENLRGQIKIFENSLDEMSSVEIEDNMFNFLSMYSAKDVSITKNEISKIYITDGGDNFIFKNIIKDGDFGIDISDSEGNSIDENIITNIKGIAISITGESSKLNKVRMNIISQCIGRGIHIWEASGTFLYLNEITAVNENPVNREILISSVQKGATTEVKRNSCEHLRIEDSKNVIISDRNILSRLTIINGEGHIISDCTINSIEGFYKKNNCVLIENSNEIEISSSTISNTIGSGIKIVNSEKINVIDNTIKNTLSYGVLINIGSKIKLLKNRFSDICSYGISIDYSDNIDIIDNEFKSIEYSAISLLQSLTSNSIYTIRGNKISHNINERAIEAHYLSGEINFIANKISNAYLGIYATNIKKGSIIFNSFNGNGTAIKTENCANFLISKNNIENSTDDFTGIHLDNSVATIEDNNLTDNNGAAIGIFNNSGAEINGNNIYDNPNLAVFNDNPNTVVNVDNNYWGGTDRPSSDIFEGNINYTTWLTEPLSLVINAEKDSIITANNTTDSVFIGINSFTNINDQIEVTVTDEQGWLINGGTTQIDLTDSTIATLLVNFKVPSDAGSTFNNKVTISAVSLTNSKMTAVDSFYILNYTPELASIKVSPDSIALGLGDSLQFNTYATDQYEKEFSGTTNYSWSVSAGTIDSTGYFRADSNQQVVTITATETNSNMTATANINVQPHTNIATIITIYPDSITVPINGTVQFYAKGKDANGFEINFNKNWISTGGTIDSLGYFTAGDTDGEYFVKVKDTLSGTEATAKVIVSTPTSVETERIIPEEYSLNQNYPNPFNPSTTISYGLPFESKVKIEIFNILGQRVDMIANGIESAGLHSSLWDAKHLASGIYIIRINAASINNNSNFTKSIKMILMK